MPNGLDFMKHPLADLPLTVDMDSEGRVWLIVGIDYKFTTVELSRTGGYNPPFGTVALVAGSGSFALALGLGLMFHNRRLARRGTV